MTNRQKAIMLAEIDAEHSRYGQTYFKRSRICPLWLNLEKGGNSPYVLYWRSVGMKKGFAWTTTWSTVSYDDAYAKMAKYIQATAHISDEELELAFAVRRGR